MVTQTLTGLLFFRRIKSFPVEESKCARHSIENSNMKATASVLMVVALVSTGEHNLVFFLSWRMDLSHSKTVHLTLPLLTLVFASFWLGS